MEAQVRKRGKKTMSLAIFTNIIGIIWSSNIQSSENSISLIHSLLSVHLLIFFNCLIKYLLSNCKPYKGS